MKSKVLIALLAMVFALGMWNCEDLPPENVPGGPTALTKIVRVSGTVVDGASLLPLYNVTVFRTTGLALDSTHTDADGAFHFEFAQSGDSAQTTVSLHKRGYLDNSYNLVTTANGAFLLNLRMTVDLSTSALLKGTIRDSSTYFPLRDATVIFSVPGFSDLVKTSVDGAFSFTIDLIDRDSLPVSVTLSKIGFKTKQLVKVVRKGQTSDLGDVLMRVDAGSTVGQVLGRVYDAQSRQPIVSASVLITSSLVTDSAFTSGDGAYSFSIDLQGLSALAASMKVTKNGYRSRNLSVDFNAGSTTYQDVYLDRDTTTGVRRDSGTGLAHSIALINLGTNQITVYGVGGTESSIIIWEVRDSLGYPIDIDHRDTVAFSLVGTPVTGGAYVSPATALTNVSGRVATIINSGTVSGVLQIVASLHRESDNTTVRSTPVLITVNAGLPDLNFFSLGPELFNFPGYDWINRTDQIIVQVGDKYSNPVKKNTAVYFSTTGGIIDASGFTDIAGHAVVNCYSGAPRPSDPFLGPGFAYITATTLGENGVTVSKSIPILFSGVAQISQPIPSSFAVSAGGSSGDISFNVSDENGNPLAAGTHISVILQYVPPPNSQVNLAVTGSVDVTMGDTQSRGAGTTDFKFRVVDQTASGVPSRINATVVIKVTSPNGTPADVQVTGSIG